MGTNYFYNIFSIQLCLSFFSTLISDLQYLLSLLLTPIWLGFYNLLLNYPKIATFRIYFHSLVKIWNISFFELLGSEINNFDLLTFYIFLSFFLITLLFSLFSIYLFILTNIYLTFYNYFFTIKNTSELDNTFISKNKDFFKITNESKSSFIFSSNIISYKIKIIIFNIFNFLILKTHKLKTINSIITKLKTIYTNVFNIKEAPKHIYDGFFPKNINTSFIVFIISILPEFSIFKFYISKLLKFLILKIKLSFLYKKFSIILNFIYTKVKVLLLTWRPINLRLPYFKKKKK